MNLTLVQTAKNITDLQQPHFKNRSLSGRVYLLKRSLDRYGYLKKHGALDILVDAEKDLILPRLLSLCAVLTK